MREVFADTAYHVAVIDTRDQHHEIAVAIGESLRREGAAFVTTAAVLVEFLTFLSAHGERIRIAATRYVDTIRAERSFTVLPQTPEMFDAALDLYRMRPDKTYSMTDCISMVVCGGRGISDVLTYDHDFEQEGFRALLRSDAGA